MYFFVLFFSIFAIIVFNLIFNFTWQTLLNLLISFAIVLLPSLICAVLIRFLPKSWLDNEHKIFKVSKKERNFYDKINIKKWKDKIPEFGQTVGFKKNKIENPNDPVYLKKFIQETVYGEILHFFCILTALLSLFFVPKHLLLCMALPIAIVYVCYNIPSLIIQRYNRPRLEVIYARSLRNAQQETMSIELESINY